MSNHQPPGAPRPPLGYPNSYPPPVMPPPYAYPTPTSQAVEQYRPTSAAPPQSHPAPPPPPPPPPPSSSNPLALPSMRSLDPLQQQQQQQQQQQHQLLMPVPMPMPMPLPGPSHHGMPMHYYAMPPQPYGVDHPMARFALPPNLYDPRVQLSGVRHKKEIKRRTKTGCLTCRKRRIKCDETHPTCNNCKKSKRECLGYDPIFKQPPNQASIQPAGAAASSHSSMPATSTSSSSSTITYVQQPTLTPSNFAASAQPPVLSFDPAHAGTPTPAGTAETSNYIDPALHVGEAPAGPSDPTSIDGRSQDALHLRGGGPPSASLSASPLPPPPLSPAQASGHAPTSAEPSVKTMKVDELIALGGTAPPARALPPARETVEEATRIYYEIYVPGLCQFFESQWYNFKGQGANPIGILLNNKPVMDLFAEFLRLLPSVSSSDAGQMAYSGNLETRLVWALTTLAYSTPAGTNPPRDDPVPEDDAVEARNRLRVFEALLTGERLPANPLMPPPKFAAVNRKKEFEFWFGLGEYLRHPAGPERGSILAKLRLLLDGRENRDVLYSLAVLRELAPRFEPGYENKVPEHLDETEPRNKLYVASQFIMTEATAAGGTTNVVRRFAFLATKSFISPGANVRRKS